ncbi:MAG: class I SAM-dependent methyltransferase [Candidatus Berkiella sp.]
MIETKDYFTKSAQDWVSGAYTKENSIGYTRARLASEAINKYKPSQKLTICDLGCGNGYFARMLAEQGHTVYGIEQSEEMLKMAYSSDDSAEKKIEYKHADIRNALNLELPDFDVITSLGVMYYFETDNDIFSFVKKKLKPNGIYVTSCRNKLFNLFPGSSSNQAALNDSELANLFREVFSLANTLEVSSLLKFVEYFKNAELPALVQNEIRSNNVNSGEKTKELLGRQHSPQDLARAAEAFGFIVDKIWAFQPHLFSARSADENAHQIQKQLSEGLMAFCELPIALIWSSHFLSVLRAT